MRFGYIPDPVTEGTLENRPIRRSILGRDSLVVQGPDPEQTANHNLKSSPGGAVYECTLCYWVGDVPKVPRHIHLSVKDGLGCLFGPSPVPHGRSPHPNQEGLGRRIWLRGEPETKRGPDEGFGFDGTPKPRVKWRTSHLFGLF